MSLYNITESEVDITRAVPAVDEVDITDEVDTVENLLALTVGISSVPNVLRKKSCSCVRSSSCTRSSCSASTT